MVEAVVLAFALAMDVSAVAAARGLLKHRGEMFVLPLLFGAFHAGMAGAGWLLGAWGGDFVSTWDHWIAFALLSLIGLRMVIDAWRNLDDGDVEPREGSVGLYVVLAFATSIDAFAAGVTLPLVPAPPWLSIVLIASIVAVCSFAAYAAGRAIGGKRLELLGGAILIALGVKILVEHL